MYTSWEHCPRYAAANEWVKLVRIVYLCSADQMGPWLKKFGVLWAPMNFLPVEKIILNIEVAGPADQLSENIKIYTLNIIKIGYRKD